MNGSHSEVALAGKSWSPVLTSLSESELAVLDRPLELIEDPGPHTKLGQQVLRLEQLGHYKIAKAVRACGRLGEKWTYECGRSEIRKIIRSHRRFCCVRCDRYLATKLFHEHRAYRERLHPASTLHLVTIRSDHRPVTGEGIRDFEDAIVRAFREHFEDRLTSGLKFLTHYEDGYLVAKGILALAPGASLPSDAISIPNANSVVGEALAASAFESMLAHILLPTLLKGNGILRAELMVAFLGGNHLRSLGILYGLVSKKRREQQQENLHLSTEIPSGAGSEGDEKISARPAPVCPTHGSSCRRVAVSIEIVCDVKTISSLAAFPEDAVWKTIRDLARNKYVSNPSHRWDQHQC
jgi:hypothetical protein